ncbi:MAG: Fe-S cluster assembly ATPase SufC [Candidatus Micrarchaeota archaeon]|nr:Fe-S cluster assembly ATPase SufC [Candidatus Micrarchaeota archaeon]MDE1834509.1 Fe-S cluster assembly ATPase SufC [Candidatus Micrarchaeota archaeon]MDE1859285.1 Fe-S cluster assembly ATPase SufC [Candidatus Micrarchaeota archaeon]
MMILEIKDLHADAEQRNVLKGLNLKIKEGELHVLMGPNGSGKTTLAKAIMGHPHVRITGGQILADGTLINDMPVNERARLGLFLQFQNPIEIEGLGIVSFLNTARGSITAGKPANYREFMGEIKDNAQKLKLREDLIGRSLNYGFSGGEKKKMEILQMSMLKPKIAILDEPDSGLDIDAVRIVAQNINEARKKTNAGMLLITHYSRILSYMNPQFIHVMADGKIAREGGKELLAEIEKGGYGTGEDE